MSELKEGVNTGVFDPTPPLGGWVSGGETGAVPVVLEESGNYDEYLPDEESQVIFIPEVFDTCACVTFSGTNCIETVINRMRAKGLLPTTHEKFLVDNGYVNKQTSKVNFSDRFTAKMSGTTTSGNSLGAVGESIRVLHGLLPESDWKFPEFAEGLTMTEMWNQYYQDVPQALQKKAKKFLEYFKITYQWTAVGTSTPEGLKADLKNGPFQIAAKVCPPWASTDGMPAIPACGVGSGHATIIYGTDGNGAFRDFDHYKSFRKLLAGNYDIPYAVQYYVEVKKLETPAFSYTYNVNLKYGAVAGTEVHKLQEGLQALKNASGTPYMSLGVFGPFGPATKAALGRFQADHGIVDPDGAGTNFGPSTRKAMNLLVSK